MDDFPILAAIVRAGVVIVEGNGRPNATCDVEIIDLAGVIGCAGVAIVATDFADKSRGFTGAIFGIADPGFTHVFCLLGAAIVIIAGRFADPV